MIRRRGHAMNVDLLTRELRKLQRGEGMGAANLDERVGPLLRTVSHADPAENRETLRIRLADLIVRHAVVLPDDVRRAVLASLALLPEARFRFLRDRQKWALGPMNRDSLLTVDRTAERGLRR